MRACFVLLILLNTSCSYKPSQLDFEENYISQTNSKELNQSELKEKVEKSYEKNKKSFQVDKVAGDLNIQFKNIPVKLLALRELKNISDFTKQDLDSVIKSYGDVKYFNLQFTSISRNLYRDITKTYKSELLSNILNNKMQNILKLDSIYSPDVFHYNSTMGIFPGFSFFIGFDNEKFQKSNKITIEKSIFNETKIELDITSLVESKS